LSTTTQAAKSTSCDTDAELAGRVRGALHARFGTPAAEIGVSAQDGAVTLHGEVATERVRVRAAQIAAEVAGVRAVGNGLALAHGHGG
jgi:osmotically-inducible protein OsmY